MQDVTLSDGTTLSIDVGSQFGVAFTWRDAAGAELAAGDLFRGEPRLTHGEITTEVLRMVIDAADKTPHRMECPRIG